MSYYNVVHVFHFCFINREEHTLHAVFDASRIDWRFSSEIDRLQQGDKLSNIVVPGYPVRFQAALIDPRHEEVGTFGTY